MAKVAKGGLNWTLETRTPAVEVTRSGLFGGPADYARRFEPGPAQHWLEWDGLPKLRIDRPASALLLELLESGKKKQADGFVVGFYAAHGMTQR